MKSKAINKFLCTVFLLYCMHGLNAQTDTSAVKDSALSPIILPVPGLKALPQWNKAPQISIEHNKQAQTPPNFQFNFSMPDNPFEVDTRGSSYYVPREIHRQIELGKGRDPDTVPIPYMYAAYLAFRALDAYVLTPLSQGEKQQVEDYLNAEKDFTLLRALWNSGGKSMADLYKMKEIHKSRSAMELKQALARLVINDLLAIRISGSSEIYYPVFSRKKVIDLFDRFLADQNNNDPDQRETAIRLHQLLLQDNGTLNFNAVK